MERHFEGQKEAVLYKKYRPCTPPIIVEKIMKYVIEKQPGQLEMMVDVGCGSGQNTLLFAEYFDRILGTDISPSMISVVTNDPTIPPNTSFSVSPAEKIPVPDGSVNVVTAAQCFHWFDHLAFHQEMNRVLKPNGVVALIGHELDYIAVPEDEKKSKELLDAISEYFDKLSPYFQKALLPLLDGYASLSFPYEDAVRQVSIQCDSPITLADYFGILDTYSQYQKWCVEQPTEALAAREKLSKSLATILGVKNEKSFDKVQTTLRLQMFLLLGRKK